MIARRMALKTSLVLAGALISGSVLPALAQRPEEGRPNEQRGGQPHAAPQKNTPRANQGHIPPAPTKRAGNPKPEVERGPGKRVNNTPHVANDHWYGQDRPNDKRYHLAQPYAHGRFANFGPSYHYNVVRVDANLHRFWLPGGFYFEVAAWDWPLAANWCWSCGDDFVVYDDPDHPGWYLVYNIHTGVYIHAQYMGA